MRLKLDSSPEPDPLHQLKNHLSIIVGYSELLLGELDDADPRRVDVLEIEKAARAALGLVPRLMTRAADRT